MVVIEPVQPSTRVPEEEENTEAKQAATTPSGGDASDGYETASDTELNEADDEEKEVRTLQGHAESKLKINESSSFDSTGATSGGESTMEEQPHDNIQQNLVSDEDRLSQANDAKAEGNALFKDGLYEEALSKYELALQVVPDSPSLAEIRSICHANRAACFSKMGKYSETVKECTKALELNPAYIKAMVRRGEAHEKLQNYEEAIADMTKILELEPSNDQARRSIVRLKPLADEKREKMKEEMIGKLKDMGNSILGRFGMSVDNFKAVKDPNTGSYSVSFQR